MLEARLESLERRKADLEEKIHAETCHAARDESKIRQLKSQKLHLKEEIEHVKSAAEA